MGSKANSRRSTAMTVGLFAICVMGGLAVLWVTVFGSWYGGVLMYQWTKLYLAGQTKGAGTLMAGSTLFWVLAGIGAFVVYTKAWPKVRKVLRLIDRKLEEVDKEDDA